MRKHYQTVKHLLLQHLQNSAISTDQNPPMKCVILENTILTPGQRQNMMAMLKEEKKRLEVVTLDEQLVPLQKPEMVLLKTNKCSRKMEIVSTIHKQDELKSLRMRVSNSKYADEKSNLEKLKTGEKYPIKENDTLLLHMCSSPSRERSKSLEHVERTPENTENLPPANSSVTKSMRNNLEDIDAIRKENEVMVVRLKQMACRYRKDEEKQPLNDTTVKQLPTEIDTKQLSIETSPKQLPPETIAKHISTEMQQSTEKHLSTETTRKRSTATRAKQPKTTAKQMPIETSAIIVSTEPTKKMSSETCAEQPTKTTDKQLSTQTYVIEQSTKTTKNQLPTKASAKQTPTGKQSTETSAKQLPTETNAERGSIKKLSTQTTVKLKLSRIGKEKPLWIENSAKQQTTKTTVKQVVGKATQKLLTETSVKQLSTTTRNQQTIETIAEEVVTETTTKRSTNTSSKQLQPKTTAKQLSSAKWGSIEKTKKWPKTSTKQLSTKATEIQLSTEKPLSTDTNAKQLVTTTTVKLVSTKATEKQLPAAASKTTITDDKRRDAALALSQLSQSAVIISCQDYKLSENQEDLKEKSESISQKMKQFLQFKPKEVSDDSKYDLDFRGFDRLEQKLAILKAVHLMPNLNRDDTKRPTKRKIHRECFTVAKKQLIDSNVIETTNQDVDDDMDYTVIDKSFVLRMSPDPEFQDSLNFQNGIPSIETVERDADLTNFIRKISTGQNNKEVNVPKEKLSGEINDQNDGCATILSTDKGVKKRRSTSKKKVDAIQEQEDVKHKQVLSSLSDHHTETIGTKRQRKPTLKVIEMANFKRMLKMHLDERKKEKLPTDQSIETNKRLIVKISDSDINAVLEKLKEVQPPNNFKCIRCMKKFESTRFLWNHVKRRHIKTKICCPTCKKNFLNYRVFLRHRFLEHHDKRIKSLSCTRCGNTVRSFFLHKEHKGLAHSCPVKEFKCYDCSRWFRTVKQLKTHLLGL